MDSRNLSIGIMIQSDKIIKILFITNLYPTEVRKDYGVFTKAQIDLALGSEKIIGDVEIIDTQKDGYSAYTKAFFNIRRKYKSYDLIHAFHGLSLVVAFMATKKIPILISFLNSIKYESMKDNRIMNIFFYNIYSIIARRNRIFKIFKDRLPENDKLSMQSYYLPNGVNLNEFYEIERREACNKLNLDLSKKYILFVSSKDKNRRQKRYDIFKKTIDFILTSHPNLNIEELVMTGVPRNIAVYYYNASSLHLVTSDWEGSPNSVKEALACNCPVVARDVGNIRMMIKDIKDCYVTQSCNPQVLGDICADILKSEMKHDYRNILKERKLDSESKNSELLSIYKDIIRKYGK